MKGFTKTTKGYFFLQEKDCAIFVSDDQTRCVRLQGTALYASLIIGDNLCENYKEKSPRWMVPADDVIRGESILNWVISNAPVPPTVINVH